MLGLESCNRNFADVIGRNPNVTHTVNELYCAAEKFAKYSNSK